MKKIFGQSSLLFLSAIFVSFLAISIHGFSIVRAQTSYALTGYAWSDNIGWISFAGSNPNYGITEDGAGNLSGYAWSDAVGWIKFGGLSGFPTSGASTSNENALIDSNGTLHGWARACAGTDGGQCATMANSNVSGGWDGWISLDGSYYSVNFASGNGQYGQAAYVWGSDVIGWINFNPFALNSSPCDPTKELCPNPIPGGTLTPTANITITPSNASLGSYGSLTWTTSNITTCTKSSSGIFVDPKWSGAMLSGTSTGATSTSIFNATGTETYSLSCTATAQAGGGTITSNQATIVISSVSSNQNGMCTLVPVNSIICSGSSAGAAQSSLVSSCSAVNGAPLCQYTCISGYHQVGNQCIGNGSVQEQ